MPKAEQMGPAPEPDRTWPHEPLRSELIEALRRCVNGAAEDETIAAVVVRCAHEARAVGLKSEQLVVALRELWNDAWGPSIRTRRDARAVTLTRLVNIALSAYHRAD